MNAREVEGERHEQQSVALVAVPRIHPSGDARSASKTTVLVAAPSVSFQIESTEPIRRLIDNRLFVSGLLLLAGPIGLPALWLNRRFSRFTKIIGTVAFIVVTVVLPIAITWYYCNTAMKPLLKVLSP